MKKPHLMTMDELLALPVFTASGVLDRASKVSGCFRDRQGFLWGTCLIEDPWKRYPDAWVRFPAACFAARTGLPDEQFSGASALRGFIDEFKEASVSGWAQDMGKPDMPVALDLTVNGKIVARVHADQMRGDLRDFGIGDGHHAFGAAILLPPPRGESQIIVAQRTFSGDVLDVAVRRPPP
jgi:hypothetical protein